MPVALLSLQADGIDVGFVGDPTYQNTAKWAGPRDEALRDSLKLEAVLRSALDSLLVAVHTLTIVVVEPALLTLPAKQAIADALFGRFRVAAVGFIQQSVCCVAGHQLSAGTVIDDVEKLAVPVYDYRELTPFIRSLDDDSNTSSQEVMKRLASRAPIDIRRALLDNVIECSRFETWIGASALLTRRSVWPLITREKHTSGKKVWDSLFHMR